MEVLTVLKVLLVVDLLLVSVEHSECIRCFAHFNLTLGQCAEELGEVDEDDCCMNPHYGYQAADGACKSCGPPVWSPWSPWSQCNVLCGDGVMQRSRTCFGIGASQCENPQYKLETQPCTGNCCDAEGWGSWLSWSSCSVTCGGGGVRKRQRVCSGPPECHTSCTGPSEETDKCPIHTCPVHGGWSSWSDWSECSGLCINDQRGDVIIPSRHRHRSCSNPTPSVDTMPPGNGCSGDEFQTQDCTELPNCPVDGNWGAWSRAGPCSVSCGEGLQLSTRVCDSPAPKFGGRFCDGSSTRSSICQSPCPVHGFWSGWSSWGECSSTCISQGQPPIRSRHRTCSNPAPSSSPPGRPCTGDNMQRESCHLLPHCRVDGGWGSWSPFSSCPVTCGVGVQVSIRRCDSPAPQHGGRPCPGEGRRTSTCNTRVHCPVDGMWSEWSAWQECRNPFRKSSINCKQMGGSQIRERQCFYRAHNGSICSGEGLTERRVCYDVSRCYIKGNWDGWEPWSLCKPACGPGRSQRFRRRKCQPDYSNYNPTIGRERLPAVFFGTPHADCGLPPDGGKKVETQPCVNLPPCP